jgi:hypothetical protein
MEDMPGARKDILEKDKEDMIEELSSTLKVSCTAAL